MNLGTIWAEIRLRTDKFTADLAAANAQIVVGEKNIVASAAKWQQIGKDISTVGKNLTKSLTLPLVALAGASVKFGLDFSKSIEYANTMLKLSGPELDKFKRGVLSLSNTYGKAATDIGKAAYSVSSVLHTSGEDTLVILDSITKAAEAGKISTEEAGNAIVRMMSIYGIQAKDTAKLVDTLSATVYAGNANWQDLANVLPQAAGAGKALGVSLTELSAAFATLSSKSGSAEEAGTGLRAVMMSLIKPSTDLQKAIEDMGYSTSQEAVQDIGLVGVLKQLGEKYGTNADALGKLFPNVRAITGALALFSNNGQDLAASLEMVKDSTGETQKQIESGTSVAERFSQAMNRLKNSGIELFSSLEPYLERAIDFINRTTKAFNKLSPGTKDAIVKFGLIVAAIGPVILIVGKLISAISGITGIVKIIIPHLKSLGFAFTSAFGPAGWGVALAIAAIGALAFAISDFVNRWKTNKAEVERELDDINNATYEAFENITGLGTAVEETSKSAAEKSAQRWKDYEKAVRNSADYATSIQMQRGKAYEEYAAKMYQNVTKAGVKSAETLSDAEISFKQRTVTINAQLTSEQIDDELEKLEAARQQKERQAWLDAAKEKLLVAETEEEIAEVQKDVQLQLDAWQYEDTVAALSKRKDILVKAAEEIAEAEQKTRELEQYYEEEAYRQIKERAQKKVDLRTNLESNLAEYLRNIHERERDSVIKAIEQERDAKLKAVQAEMDAVQKQYDDALEKIYGERDARLGIIDEKIAKLQEQHEKERRAEELAGLEKAVSEAETPEERARAEKELNKQIAEWAYEDKLEALRKEGEAVRALAEEKIGIANKEYEDKKKQLEVELEDTQKYYDDQITATQKFCDDLMLLRNLDAEAQKLLAEKTNKEILDMLEATKSEWASLGAEIGDTFWSNLMGGITNLEELLKLLGKLPVHGGGGGGLAAFAEGGAVYGPTLALLGETATPGNPEIVIPPGAGSSPNIEFILCELLDQMRMLNAKTMPNVRDGIANSISGLGRKI